MDNITLSIADDYIGSAFSPIVEIEETSDDVTVTITDYAGEHAYTVAKTDGAIADAEAAAAAADAAAANADAKATIANAQALSARDAARSANAAAANANSKAADALEAADNADSAAEDALEAASAANSAATSANQAAQTANTAAANADAKAAIADEAASNADVKSALADTAAANATAKAAIADAAATNAETKAALADTAAATAITAAGSADAAREAIQSDLAAKADADGHSPLLVAGSADTLMGSTPETASFLSRTSTHSGVARLVALRGATEQANGELVPVNVESINGREIPVSTYFPDGMNGVGTAYDELAEDKAVQRIRTVDGGAFNYNAGSASGVWYLATSSTPKKPGTTNFAAAGYEVVNVNAANLADMQATGSGSNNRMYFRNDACTTKDEMKAAMTGVTLAYELATPVTTQIDPPLELTYHVEQGGTEAFSVPSGETSATPAAEIAYSYTAEELRDSAQSAIATVEGATASRAYASGDYLVSGAKLYRVVGGIASGATIVPGSNAQEVTVMGEFGGGNAVEWEFKKITAADGAVSDASNRLKSRYPLPKWVSYIEAAEGYQLGLFAYDNGAYVGWWNSLGWSQSAISWRTVIDLSMTADAAEHDLYLVIRKSDADMTQADAAGALMYAADDAPYYNYVVGSDLQRRRLRMQYIGTLTYLQSFLRYDGKYYSVTEGHIGVQDADFTAIQSADLSFGHGNAFSLGADGKGYISGWEDNTLYEIDLETLTITDTVTLPVSGYTTCCIDADSSTLYIFHRTSSPSTPERYDLVVYDMANEQILRTCKTSTPYASMQACDVWRDRIIVLHGQGTASKPNGIVVYDTYGQVLAEYVLGAIASSEPEGVFIDRATGELLVSNAAKRVFRLTLA